MRAGERLYKSHLLLNNPINLPPHLLPTYLPSARVYYLFLKARIDVFGI